MHFALLRLSRSARPSRSSWRLWIGLLRYSGAALVAIVMMLAVGYFDETEIEFFPIRPGDAQGSARVVDGDALEINGEMFLFHGIDAPESDQTCVIDGKPWACGQEARQVLAQEIGDRHVRCEERHWDPADRIAAVCFAGFDDLNAFMVRTGWALAYRQHSTDYIAEEHDARAARRGLWASEFVEPWKWRQAQGR